MDYCYITDVGISYLTTMHTLTELSLSRTKLTDAGMVFLEGQSSGLLLWSMANQPLLFPPSQSLSLPHSLFIFNSL